MPNPIRQILLVDDEQHVLDAMRRMLHAQRGIWHMTCANSAAAAWSLLVDRPFDAMVCDVNMPEMSGLQLLERVKASARLRDVPVVMLTGLGCRSLKRQALELGAADLLDKPVAAEDLVARLRSALRLKAYQDELRAHNALLEQRVEARTAELYRSRLDIIWRLGKAAEQRDDETGNHVIRVACISRVVAQALAMPEEFVESLFVAAPLHDIGKIGIPDSILLKPGPLSRHEWEVMREHCQIGAKILQEDALAETAFDECLGRPARCGEGSRDNPFLKRAAVVALAHHERWDGTGYPRGLAGAAIPLEARIVAIADVFDALTSCRPYKPPYPERRAFQIIRDAAGSHFDPRVFAAFREALPEIKDVRRRLSDGIDPWRDEKEVPREEHLVC
jgi:putative two-component system response regulator